MNVEYCKNCLEGISRFKEINKISTLLVDEDMELIRKRADELSSHIFVFDKPWDMERCIVPYQLDEDIDWNIQLNGDEEWCFMLNRMDYLNYLILDSLVSGDTKSALKAKEFILSWIGKHKAVKMEPGTRTLDTGIRIMNWFEAMPYLYELGCLSDDEINLITDSIYAQAEYLKENYLTKYITSNWGSIQTFSLVSILPYIKSNYKEDPVYIWALEECKRQCIAQVYPDGMHWEQSTMYHIEVLNYGMKLVFYQQLKEKVCDSIIVDSIHRLAECLFLQLTPSMEIETFGDSDRSLIKDVMCRASYLFNLDEFKYAGFETFDLESMYIFGAKAATIYDLKEMKCPEQKYYDGTDSGMYAVRSSWESDANYMMYTNGSLGSGHGHSDNQHVSVYYKGKPISIDSGRLTYREDHPLRVALKSMYAHNVVIVDDKVSSVPKDSWTYDDFSLPLKNYVRHNDNVHYYEGVLMGHNPLQVWNRKVIFAEVGIWFIVDSIFEDGKHNAEARFHLDPSVTYKNLPLNFITTGDVKIDKGPCSIRYNEELDHEIIKSRFSFENEGRIVSMFVDSSFAVEKVDILQDGVEKVDDDVAIAYKFTNEEESLTFGIFNKEIYKGKKVFFMEGIPFHGKAIFVYEHNGEKKYSLLKA